MKIFRDTSDLSPQLAIEFCKCMPYMFGEKDATISEALERFITSNFKIFGIWEPKPYWVTSIIMASISYKSSLSEFYKSWAQKSEVTLRQF